LKPVTIYVHTFYSRYVQIHVATTISIISCHFIMKQDLLSTLENHQEFQKINLVRVLRQSVRLITNQISKNLIKHGHPNLSARHLNVFENLTAGDNNIVTLANRAGISKQAMSKLVKEIAAEGYIDVVTDKRDSRLQIVKLTEKGGSFLLTLQKELLNKYYEVLEVGEVTKSDMETVYKTVKSITRFLESETNGGVGEKTLLANAYEG
jgi:DNA-binding MarR family transcriptional regulator